jgi:hypothetical protein
MPLPPHVTLHGDQRDHCVTAQSSSTVSHSFSTPMQFSDSMVGRPHIDSSTIGALRYMRLRNL